MLSKYNVEKLNLNGLYSCQANPKYREYIFQDSLYHCCNWTFTVVRNGNDEYFMRDTFWNSGESLHIKINDDNIDEFELIFEDNKVREIKGSVANQYEKVYKVAVDSGGVGYPKYFIDNEAKKSKTLVIEEINNEIESLGRKLEYLRERKENIENDVYDLEWA